jgi:hypothetical protein
MVPIRPTSACPPGRVRPTLGGPTLLDMRGITMNRCTRYCRTCMCFQRLAGSVLQYRELSRNGAMMSNTECRDVDMKRVSIVPGCS